MSEKVRPSIVEEAIEAAERGSLEFGGRNTRRSRVKIGPEGNVEESVYVTARDGLVSEVDRRTGGS